MTQTTPIRRPRGRLIALVIVLAAVGGLAGFLHWYGSGPGFYRMQGDNSRHGKKPDRGVPVETIQVLRGDLTTTLTSTAALESERSVDVVSKTEGVVTAVRVEEGDHVKKGDILCVLDDEPAGLTLRKAQLNLESAASELSRADELKQRDLITAKDYDEARLKYRIAQAERAEAEVGLAYTTIRAPFSGVVVSRHVELGQALKPAQVTFSISDTDPLVANAFLPEQDIYGLVPGTNVRLTVASLNGHASHRGFSGVIERFSPVVDPATGTVKVRITTSNPPAGVRPGTFVKMSIDLNHRTDTLTIPKAALLREGSRSYVFLANGPRAKKTQVTLGEQNKVHVEIAEGLKEGDRIVLTGKEGLRDGTLLQKVDAEPPVPQETPEPPVDEPEKG